MNRKDFINYLYETNKKEFDEAHDYTNNSSIVLTKKLIGEFLDMFLSGTTDVLAEGKDVKISGFGTFHTVKTTPRSVKVPSTGEVIMTKPKKVVKFKTGNTLKEAIQ